MRVNLIRARRVLGSSSQRYSSGQTNLHPPIWGHCRQLDDRNRNPNINIREIIWLGNQLPKVANALVSLKGRRGVRIASDPTTSLLTLTIGEKRISQTKCQTVGKWQEQGG